MALLLLDLKVKFLLAHVDRCSKVPGESMVPSKELE